MEYIDLNTILDTYRLVHGRSIRVSFHHEASRLVVTTVSYTHLENFKKWVENKLLPNIVPESVIVMDNGNSYGQCTVSFCFS